MQYLIILKNANGMLRLDHIAKLINKSYSQVTRDIKKIEELELIKSTTLETKNKVIIMRRKSYKNIFSIDKRIKNNSSYTTQNLEKNFLKAYIYNRYDSDNHDFIKKYLYEKYFNSTSPVFKEKNKDVFKIFNDQNIMFYSYEERLNIVRVIISCHRLDKENVRWLLLKLERIYRLFYLLGLDDICIDVTIITYIRCNKDYILKSIKKYKTIDKYYSSNKFEQVLDLNFFGCIDFESIEGL